MTITPKEVAELVEDQNPQNWEYVSPVGFDCMAELIAAQAAEIKRLKEHTRLVEGERLRLCDRIEKRDVEIERLRGALGFYANDHANPNDGPFGISSDDFGDVARAALKDKTQ